MINVADNPAVRAQIEQTLARQEQQAVPERQYARAPDGPGYVQDGSGAGRPPATQGGAR